MSRKRIREKKIHLARYFHICMQNSFELSEAIVSTNNGTKEIRKKMFVLEALLFARVLLLEMHRNIQQINKFASYISLMKR